MELNGPRAPHQGGYLCEHVLRRKEHIAAVARFPSTRTGPHPCDAVIRQETAAELVLDKEAENIVGYREFHGSLQRTPKQGSLLIMTHPGGAKSFDYGDYWDGGDLIYAGRGKLGDQKLDGQNRDLAENRRAVLAFEPAGARQLRFLGQAHCVGHWWTREPDQEDKLRRVLRYRLRFDTAASSSTAALVEQSFPTSGFGRFIF